MNSPPSHSYAIIPAAGESIRMGEPKLLLPWGEGNVIEAVIDAWKASLVEQVFVVVHPSDQALADCCRAAGAEVFVPTSPPPDMRASVCEGLNAIQLLANPSTGDVFLVAPADMPGLSPQVVDLLLTTHDPDRPRILVPTHQGKHGHPVLIPWVMAPDVLQLPETVGLNALLARRGIREVACSASGVPEDLDTPEDYQRLRRMNEES